MLRRIKKNAWAMSRVFQTFWCHFQGPSFILNIINQIIYKLAYLLNISRWLSYYSFQVFSLRLMQRMQDMEFKWSKPLHAVFWHLQVLGPCSLVLVCHITLKACLSVWLIGILFQCWQGRICRNVSLLDICLGDMLSTNVERSIMFLYFHPALWGTH